MPTLTFISPSKKTFEVEASNGQTLMEIAVENNVEGIDADCEGSCACATCHIIVPDDYRKIAGPAHEDESALLDFLDNRRRGSRLSCQMEMMEELDGMTVTIPPIE